MLIYCQAGEPTPANSLLIKKISSTSPEKLTKVVYLPLCMDAAKAWKLKAGEGYGRRLTFADVVWTEAGGDPADKPAEQEWVGDDDALALYGRSGRHRYGVYINEDITDGEELLLATWDYLQTINKPRTTYELDVISLEELTGYKHEAVRIGDTVRVIDREFTPELVVSARIIEIDRDLLQPQNTKVVLGSFAPKIIETTINTQQHIYDIENRPYNTKWLDGIIDVLQNSIENTQAYIWETPAGTLHMNAATYDEANAAMLLGAGMFAIANQKRWTWRMELEDLWNRGRIYCRRNQHRDPKYGPGQHIIRRRHLAADQ